MSQLFPLIDNRNRVSSDKASSLAFLKNMLEMDLVCVMVKNKKRAKENETRLTKCPKKFTHRKSCS